MTRYRRLPTKEDLALRDEYNPLIVERIAARSATEPLIQRIGQPLIEELDLAIGAGLDERPRRNADAGRGAAPRGRALLLARRELVLSTPALRARRWNGQYATQKAIVESLRGDPHDPDLEFRLSKASAACLAAASATCSAGSSRTAAPISHLMTEALAVLFEGGSR